MPYQDEEQLKKAIKQRILMINEDLRQNLLAVSLEENFERNDVVHYYESRTQAIELRQNVNELTLNLTNFETRTYNSLQIMDGQISLRVQKDDLITQLNVETTGISLKSNRFIVNTDNFKVNSEGVYVNGIVEAETGKIGKWNFQNKLAYGDEYTEMAGGTIEANTATCKFVTAKKYDLNPTSGINYHEVDMSHSIWQVGESNGELTEFDGNLTSYGILNFEGKVDAYDDIHCTRLRCVSEDGEYTRKHIIYCNEIVTNTQTWSDERLKKNIVPVTDEEAGMINELRPVRYRFIKNDAPAVGLVAQEIKPVLESHNIHSVVTENDGYLGIRYKELIPLMVKQVQKNVETLERIRYEEKSKLQA